MKGSTIRRWRLVHEWTSLASTLFLFLLCLTGLPLIFADEIDGPSVVANTGAVRAASLDAVVRRAGVVPGFVRIAPDEGRIYLGPAGGGQPLLFDAGSGEPIAGGRPRAPALSTVLLALHGELLAGIAGRMFIALVALCALVAVVSGVAIHAPFAGERPFGDVRHGQADRRGTRLGWLDRHNLIGIASATWLLVMTATGFMNAIEHPLFALWRSQVPRALPVVKTGAAPHIGPDRALSAARATAPGMIFETIIFPGPPPGIPGYFLVWGEGASVRTARLSAPVAVDAATGKAFGRGPLPMPWYLAALDLSRPLHFGDYGGMPLRIIWSLFDLATIMVLGSGLYLRVARGRRRPASDRSRKSVPLRVPVDHQEEVSP